jgi:hypothetical protein
MIKPVVVVSIVAALGVAIAALLIGVTRSGHHSALGCGPVPQSSKAPDPALSSRLVIGQPSIASGDTLEVVVEFKNAGSRPVTFLSGTPTFAYFIRDGRVFGGFSGATAGKGDTVVVPAHGRVSRTIRIDATSCIASSTPTSGTARGGRQSGTSAPPLPPGKYELKGFVNVSSASHYWHTPPVTIEVTPRR